MADKEATVYIVDMGRTMGEIRNGRTESDLDWAMTYVWDKITSTVIPTNSSQQRFLLMSKGSHRTQGRPARSDWVAHRSYGQETLPRSTNIHSPAGTENELDKEESFEHISVIQKINQ